jgi:hypothetical protein
MGFCKVKPGDKAAGVEECQEMTRGKSRRAAPISPVLHMKVEQSLRLPSQVAQIFTRSISKLPCVLPVFHGTIRRCASTLMRPRINCNRHTTDYWQQRPFAERLSFRLTTAFVPKIGESGLLKLCILLSW